MNRGIYLSNNPLHTGDPRTTNLYHDLKNLSFRLARNAAPPGLVKIGRMWSQWKSTELIKKLGGGFKYFLFLPLPGEMIEID